MNARAIKSAAAGSVSVGVLKGSAAGAAALALLLCATVARARAADPLVVVSVQSGTGTTICDTGFVPPSPNCFSVDEEDLILCRPTSSGLPITACDWELFMQGDSAALQINAQLRAAEVAPNGSIAFVALNDTTVPGIGAVESDDIIVFTPDDVFKPFVGGGPYDDGALKLYLNGDLSQSTGSAKPWDAIEILPDGTCQAAIDATTTDDHSCPIIGSLSGGTPGAGLDGVHARDEDLLRCVPSAFAANGTVENCDFALFLYTSRLNGVGNGFTSEIKAIDLLSFDPPSMSGELVFKKGSGTITGVPHDPGKDLLLYDGTFGVGNCVPSGNPCASASDCLLTDSACDTGTCAIGGAPCAHDDDCAGGGNTCTNPRTEVGTFSKFFDGVAVGLTGSGQNIEAFTVLGEADGDGIPDGADNCPNEPNPPATCSGPGPETCPSGLSTECPVGETCEQADTDGDGVGDVCDQCNGRPDEGTCDACPFAPCPAPCAGNPANDCSCGDAVLDLPAEQCDLGDANGDPGSPCTAVCATLGHCVDAPATPCTSPTDCGGQGCCGNAAPEAGEDCDDGNVIENDLCTSACVDNPLGTPILGCEDLIGPNIVPAAIKSTKFKDKPDFADFDRWKTKGSFVFSQGLTFDPETQDVKIIYNNTASGLLFESTLHPGDCNPPLTSCFVQSGTPAKPNWKFLDKEADIGAAPSWRKGKFKVKNSIQGAFTLDGRNVPLFTLAELGGPPVTRQTVRVDDLCITGVVNCELSGNSKGFKCSLVP